MFEYKIVSALLNVNNSSTSVLYAKQSSDCDVDKFRLSPFRPKLSEDSEDEAEAVTYNAALEQLVVYFESTWIEKC